MLIRLLRIYIQRYVCVCVPRTDTIGNAFKLAGLKLCKSVICNLQYYIRMVSIHVFVRLHLCFGQINLNVYFTYGMSSRCNIHTNCV